MNDSKSATFDSYLKPLPENVQEILRTMRKRVLKIVPEAVESIGYGIPTFKLNGTYLVYIAGYKSHVSMYPINTLTGPLQKEIAPYITGKGTAQFKLDQPIPYELIDKFVAYRKQQVLEKTS